MTTIFTSSGQAVEMRNPRPEAFTIDVIAHSLAQINRFGGHARRPYSVAEHSLLVCEIAERELGLNVHGRLAALMHDAHETFATDMMAPAKDLIVGWRIWEAHWMDRVRQAFAVRWLSHQYAAAIHAADMRALATERRDLLPPAASAAHWPCLDGHAPVDWVDLNAPERVAMTWLDWRSVFTDRYLELEFARLDQAEEPAA